MRKIVIKTLDHLISLILAAEHTRNDRKDY